ncbi:cell division protein SepF [Actinomyces mediterranea]|uniref:cell division protein SepF n=1 Tax=Actinomyces mediterranea TaxID=1871028 RepID=UPI000971150F|nr:cell division protein SepF [Actinomyces mediterranea]
MGDTFGAKARKFMGWYTPEDAIDDVEEFEEYTDVAPVTEIAPVERPVIAPVHREVREVAATDLSRIVTVHPSAYSDAVTIGEAFRQGTPVIMNLTDMNEEDARRLVDFAAGLTFGLHGVIERVTSRVFLLSPRTVEVTGDVAGSRRGSLFNQG